jgi:hypothetical protein
VESERFEIVNGHDVSLGKHDCDDGLFAAFFPSFPSFSLAKGDQDRKRLIMIISLGL